MVHIHSQNFDRQSLLCRDRAVSHSVEPWIDVYMGPSWPEDSRISLWEGTLNLTAAGAIKARRGKPGPWHAVGRLGRLGARRLLQLFQSDLRERGHWSVLTSRRDRRIHRA
jgi:hypothetical protein